MGAVSLLRNLLAHPLTRGLEIDDPRTTDLRRQIVRDKPFLYRIYREWYTSIAQALPSGAGPTLELGSGAGFLEEFVPDLITSDIFPCKGNRLVLDGQQLPFGDGVLRGIAMTDVLHHIPQPRRFFTEAARCLRPGGVLVMIEPWVSPWSTRVYRSLHHEPFRPDSAEWEFPSTGPLSGANGAMPWIIFHRDRARFEKEFPALQVRSVTPMMPFRYLVSGGVSMRALSPGWSFPIWRGIEAALRPVRNAIAMFARIEVRRGT
jgi:SAM-dependent methyltransferase